MSKLSESENAACNICGGSSLEIFRVPSAPPLQNVFLNTYSDAVDFHRTVVRYFWCKICTHLSIHKDTSLTFTKSYDNNQMTSLLSREHLALTAKRVTTKVTDRSARIVEIGCADGTLLDLFSRAGYKNIRGFDPAAKSTMGGVITQEYWTEANADLADIFILRHTLAEIVNIKDFIALLASKLTIGGLIYCEETNLTKCLDDEGVFSLYPEYSNMFSATSIGSLFAQFNLFVENIDSIDDSNILGIWARKRESPTRNRIDNVLQKLGNRLRDLPKPLFLWGAGGKASDILSFLQLGVDECHGVIDIDPAKQGKFMPPYGVEVVSPEALKAYNKCTVLLCNAKYKAEVEATAPNGAAVIVLSDLLGGNR